MIRFARRDQYFSKEPNSRVHWMEIQPHHPYSAIKFIQWVFEINGKVYERGSPEFKEAFNKARAWSLLKADQ